MEGAGAPVAELLAELLFAEPWFACAAWVRSPLRLTTPGSEVGLATISGCSVGNNVFIGAGEDGLWTVMAEAWAQAAMKGTSKINANRFNIMKTSIYSTSLTNILSVEFPYAPGVWPFPPVAGNRQSPAAAGRGQCPGFRQKAKLNL
jgi:hypothetical protein